MTLKDGKQRSDKILTLLWRLHVGCCVENGLECKDGSLSRFEAVCSDPGARLGGGDDKCERREQQRQRQWRLSAHDFLLA